MNQTGELVHQGALTKIAFKLERSGEGYPPADWEHLWAVRQSDGNYELDNTPFFAMGVSYLDVIAATLENGLNVFQRVVRPSGHSTLRVILFEVSMMDTLRAALLKRGCATELSHLPNLVAVDVPPEVDIREIRTFLEGGAESGVWDFEEAAVFQ